MTPSLLLSLPRPRSSFETYLDKKLIWNPRHKWLLHSTSFKHFAKSCLTNVLKSENLILKYWLDQCESARRFNIKTNFSIDNSPTNLRQSFFHFQHNIIHPQPKMNSNTSNFKFKSIHLNLHVQISLLIQFW